MRYAILTTKCLAIYEPQEKSSSYAFKPLMELDVMTLKVERDEEDCVFVVRGTGKRYKSVADRDNNNVIVKLKVSDTLVCQRWMDMIKRATEMSIRSARQNTDEMFRKASMIDTPKMMTALKMSQQKKSENSMTTSPEKTEEDDSFHTPMRPMDLPPPSEDMKERRSPESLVSSSTRARTNSDNSSSVASSASSSFFGGSSESSSRSFLGSVSSSSIRSDEPVMKSGQLMKLKKGGTDKWKNVELKLRPSSLEYSYQKKMALMMPWTVRHQVRLQDVEQVIEDPLRPKYFTIDMLIGTPIPLRASSAEVAQSWIQIIRNALRPHQELMAARNQELDCVSSSALLCDDYRTSNDEDEDMMMSLDNVKPSNLMDLGFMWKKSKVWKEWRIRRFRLEPTLGLLQYSRPEDPEGLSQTEHWFIKGGRVEPVDVNYTIDLYVHSLTHNLHTYTHTHSQILRTREKR